MSVQPIQAVPRGSAPFISGTPKYFAALESLSEDLLFLMEEAISNALSVAREDLRSSARHADGWASIANDLHVDWDGEAFVYFAAGDSAVVAERLEYGDGGSAPTGFLRKIAIKQAPVLAGIVSASISEALNA